MKDRGRTSGSHHVAVVVAHPDDEILWCGGLLLNHPEWKTFVAVLCRSSDPDRSPRCARVFESLGVEGAMGDLDDGPEQTPLSDQEVREGILSLLPQREYDLILTHSPFGEYTRHRRHEECGRALWSIWREGLLGTPELWTFAYEDGGKAYLPRPSQDADLSLTLPEPIWREKLRLISEVYGFDPQTWEARITPRTEAFRCFDSRALAAQFFEGRSPP